MITKHFKLLAALPTALGAFVSGASAGTFKHIAIDGSFNDWVGVPLAYTQAQDTTNVVAYKSVYVANDDNYLYIRFSIYGSDDPFTYLQNIFVDADNNLGTGFGAHGLVGSEMLIQGGAGYQERGGAFNEGGINGLDWLSAPAAPASEFEVRISRSATYASDGSPVFTNGTIAFVLESDNSAFANIEWFPPTGNGITYTFEEPPPVLTTNISLVGLNNTSWRANASGTDLGTNWLADGYDDSQSPWISGLGLFGFTPSPGSYPAIQTALPAGANTYYFRTHFNWSNETANVAFVVTNYLSDGAVYYLNGAEVRRDRMLAGSVAYGTSASGTNFPVGHAEILGFSGSGLIIGDNVLEVETHQAPASSADMVFGLSLTASVLYPITIVNTNLPADQTVVGGQPVTFSADLVGSGPMGFQWLKNGTIITDATNAAFNIPLVLTNDIGAYSLRITNAISTNTTRAAQLNVTSTPVTIIDPTQPMDQIVMEGRPVTMTVLAGGSALVEYQWFQGATAIAGATNALYTIPFSVPTNSGSYHAFVHNPASSTNSRTATLTVLRDSIPPAVTNIAAGSTQIVIGFSEPVDAATANVAAHYTLSGGVTVSSAVINPANASQVTLTTGTPLSLGTVYSLTISGVNDLFGNSASTSVSFARRITIDGNFGDWAGVEPIYSGPSGSDGAADFENIYMFDDANAYYFRVTLWHDIPSSAGQFPAYVNMFFDTDNNPGTGYSAIGSELLIQSGFSYQEKNGGFNEGSINGLNWQSLPTAPGTDFEFSFSKSATYASDGKPVFTTNVLNYLFQGMTPAFTALNQAPSDGGLLSYTNQPAVNIPLLALGRLSIAAVPGANAAILWDAPGTLQASGSLTGNGWTNVPAATSPYIIPTTGGKLFFRLVH